MLKKGMMMAAKGLLGRNYTSIFILPNFTLSICMIFSAAFYLMHFLLLHELFNLYSANPSFHQLILQSFHFLSISLSMQYK